jgi:hypothetical protein
MQFFFTIYLKADYSSYFESFKRDFWALSNKSGAIIYLLLLFFKLISKIAVHLHRCAGFYLIRLILYKSLSLSESEFGTYAFLLSRVVNSHCSGTMTVVLPFLECNSDTYIISDFGTHIPMDLLGLVLRFSLFLCLLVFTEGLELFKLWNWVLGLDWFLELDPWCVMVPEPNLALEVFIPWITKGFDMFWALAWGFMGTEVTCSSGLEVFGSDELRTYDFSICGKGVNGCGLV